MNSESLRKGNENRRNATRLAMMRLYQNEIAIIVDAPEREILTGDKVVMNLPAKMGRITFAINSHQSYRVHKKITDAIVKILEEEGKLLDKEFEEL